MLRATIGVAVQAKAFQKTVTVPLLQDCCCAWVLYAPTVIIYPVRLATTAKCVS